MKKDLGIRFLEKLILIRQREIEEIEKLINEIETFKY